MFAHKILQDYKYLYTFLATLTVTLIIAPAFKILLPHNVPISFVSFMLVVCFIYHVSCFMFHKIQTYSWVSKCQSVFIRYHAITIQLMIVLPLGVDQKFLH